jgi:alpha(1,3/1,4) fucosyltransferase
MGLSQLFRSLIDKSARKSGTAVLPRRVAPDMIALFFAETMQDTLFARGRWIDVGGHGWKEGFTENRIALVSDAAQADVIVGRTLDVLRPYLLDGKTYYVWTHEPRYCQAGSSSFIDAGTGVKVHVSNVFSGDIYINPLCYFKFRKLQRERHLQLAKSKSRACAILATYRQRFDRYYGDVNVDLAEHRQQIAIYLNTKHNACDIYGRGWPKHVKVTGESRAGAWQTTKINILKDYKFNLAIENTMAKYLVTEKIWNAIESGCVPVYFAKDTGIDEVLRPDSYVDVSACKSYVEVHDVLSSITDDRRCEMVESGLEDWNRLVNTMQPPQQQMVQNFCDKVVRIAGRSVKQPTTERGQRAP